MGSTDAYLSLLLGVVFTVVAIADFAKYRNWTRVGRVMLVLAGAALLAIGVLDLLGLIDRGWARPSMGAATGVFAIVTSAAIQTNRTKKLVVLLGLLLILSATLDRLADLWP